MIFGGGFRGRGVFERYYREIVRAVWVRTACACLLEVQIPHAIPRSLPGAGVPRNLDIGFLRASAVSYRSLPGLGGYIRTPWDGASLSTIGTVPAYRNSPKI